MRRAVLLAIAVGVPLLWALAPDGRMPPGFASVEPGEAQTLAGTMIQTAREVWQNPPRRLNDETAVMLTVFPGLAAPLYPAFLALLLLAAPHRLAARPRWKWILEGIVVLVLSPIGALWALFALLILIPGAAAPTLYPTLWLLPGFAALAGLTAIAIGIFPRGRIARFVLGATQQP